VSKKLVKDASDGQTARRDDATTRRRRAEAFLMRDASSDTLRTYAAGKKAKRASDRKAWWDKHGGSK